LPAVEFVLVDVACTSRLEGTQLDRNEKYGVMCFYTRDFNINRERAMKGKEEE
jgi:hypothetical protein